MLGSANLIREATRKTHAQVVPIASAQTPAATSVEAPIVRKAVYRPLPPHSIYKDLMRSHDRVHTRHLHGNDIYRPQNI